MRLEIAEANAGGALAGRGSPAPVCRNAQALSRCWSFVNQIKRVAAAELPEITPFPSAQVGLARCWAVPLKKVRSPAKIMAFDRALREVHIRRVGLSPRCDCLRLGLLPKQLLLRFSFAGFLLVCLRQFAL